MTKLESSNRPVRFPFSLRALFAITLLAASYFAGWVSQRAWNKQNVDEAILKATQRLGAPVQVKIETPKDAPGVLTLRGKKDAVEKMEEAVRDVEAAAKN